MIRSTRKRDGIVSSRACLIALLVTLLVFPPWMFGDQMTWNGGTGAYNEANWSCNNCDPNDTATYPANGQTFNGTSYNYNVSIHSGGGNNSSVVLDNIEQGLDAVTVDSMSIRGGHVASTASLTVQNGEPLEGTSALTIGNPASTQGNALYIGNRGSLNITNFSTVTLELSGGGGSLHPGAPNSVGAYIGSGGSVNVSDFGALELQNTSGGTRALTNNGIINIGGDGAPAALLLSSQGTPSNFLLGGNGSLTMDNAYVVGLSGAESLTSGSSHTISGNGLIEVGNFTNNGTLTASGGTMEVAGLGNYNGVTGKLTNGSYGVQDGATMELDSVGLGNSITSLNLVNMQLTTTGTITGGGVGPIGLVSGQSSGVHTGALAPPTVISGLTHLTDSSLTLQGVTTTITPTNNSGTLTLRSDPLGIPTTLTVEQDVNTTLSSNVTIAGNVKNISSTTVGPEPYDNFENRGSSIDVYGSSLSITGNLSNKAYVNPPEGFPPNQSPSNANINLSVGSLTVGGNLNTYTNNGFAYSSIEGADSTLTVNGNFRQGGGFGAGPLSGGNDSTYLTGGSSLTVNGNFTNNNALNASTVTLDASTATVTGWFGQFQGTGGAGSSQLILQDASSMTVGNLRNSTGAFSAGTLGFSPQSQINITGNSSLTVNGTFANINANGVLTGGSYDIEGDSALNYTGANITAIGANTALSLSDNGGSATGKIQNNGSDAISGSLNEVAGSLALNYNGVLNLTSANGLTIDSGGQVNLNQIINGNTTSGNASLSAVSLTNNGQLNTYYSGGSVNVTTLGNLNQNVLSGGTWNLVGNVNFGGGTDGSTAITGLSGATVSIGPIGGFFNNGAEAMTGLNSVASNSTFTINGQARSFGPLNVDSSTLNLASGANVTFNGPAGPTGDGLSLTNGATMNVAQSTATLNLAGGNTASITGSTLNINDGGTLALTGGTSDTPGVVNVNTNGALNLQALSSGPAGVLSVTDGGSYQINGTGSVNNGGAIDVSNGSLTVNAFLTNLSGGTLTVGSYIIGNGSTLQLSGIGPGNSLTTLAGANVSITGTGVLTGGTPILVGGPQVVTNASSAPPPSALAGLTELDGSTLSLINAGNVTITPGTSSAGPNTFLLDNAIDAGTSGTLNLRQGTNLSVAGSFESNGGNVNITNGSSLAIGGSFFNIDGSGSLGGNGNVGVGQGQFPINLAIGSGSSLVYTGADITSIFQGSTLTLGNREGNGTGTIQNLAGAGGQHDALSGTLSYIGGTLNLQNGANLTLTGAQGSFQNGGNVTITNGSTFDVSSLAATADGQTGFLDIDVNGNQSGNYFIGSNSVLNYSGPSNVTAIGGYLTLDNSNGGTTGMITNGTGNDALSGSLTANYNTLTLQNNANLTLTGAQSSFANYGTVNITNGSTFDVSALGSNFSDVDGSGNLNGLSYFIGSNSVLNYSGANITAINGFLTLDNSNNGTTGGITNGGPGNDALSGSLTTINGTLNIQNNASVELSSSSGVTISPGGTLNIDQSSVQGNSELIVDNKLTNYNGQINVGSLGNPNGSYLAANGGLVNRSDDNNSDFVGSSNISSTNGYIQVTGNFFNGSFSNSGLPNEGGATAKTTLDGGSFMQVSGNLKNLALGGTASNSDFFPPGDTLSNATISLSNGSFLQVNGNVRNIAVQGQTDDFGFTTANASINLDGASGLNVGGTFTNYSGNAGYGGLASLNLTNASSVTVSGLFTNSGFSEVTLDGDDQGDSIGNGGSTLNAQGGFKNYNSGVYLNNLSTLNVQGGFQNLADDSNNSAGDGYSILAIGGNGEFEGSSQRLTTGSLGLGLQTSNEGFGFGGPSVATITGGLVNSASTSNGGYAESVVAIAPGSTLNVDNLTNSAMNATAGGGDEAFAGVFVSGTLNVTGNLTNTSSTPFFGGPNSQATIGSYGSQSALIEADLGTLNIGGSLTNTNADVDIASSTLNASNGILNLATDTNFDIESPGATSLSGYSELVLESDCCGPGSTAVVKGGLTNSASSTLGGYAEADIYLVDGSTMTVTAPTSAPSIQGPVYALTNLASATSFSSSNSTFGSGPFIGSSNNSLANATVTVDGTFGASSLTVNGNFLNQASMTSTGTNSDSTTYTIPLATAITTISNGGGFTVNGNILNTTVVSGGPSGPIAPAATINVNGASTLMVTGTFNNTAGTLNVTGSSTATVAGLFTNDSNSVVNLNQNDPQLTEPTQGSSLTTGHIAPSLPTTVLSTHGFSNAGAVNLNDDTMLVNTGTFLNTGNVLIGNGSILNTADNGDGVYSQTGGMTTIWAGGTLTADSIDITGGTVMGGGVENGSDTTAATFNGNVTNSATLNLGDPMALDVVGTYDQTMLGILDLSLDGVGDNGTFTGSLDDNNAYDQVNVTGNVLALDGTLNLNLEAGFLSSVVQGDYFNVLNWTGTDGSTDACTGSAEAGCFGTFNDVTFTDSLGNLDTFVEQINAGDGGTELDLLVVGVSSTATPEPGTLSMFFCAMLIGGGVTWYRRKRRGMAE